MLKIFSPLLEVLYPYRCVVCHKIVEQRAQVCPACLQVINIRFVEPRVLPNSQLDGLIFCAHYHDLKGAIHKAKFEQDTQDIQVLGGALTEVWGRVHTEYFAQQYGVRLQECEAVCVPTDYKRRMKRGYDVPQLLFEAFLAQQGIALKNIMRRVKLTAPQFALNRLERQLNVAGSIEVVATLQGGSFLLLDDIFTTGASMNEAAKALKMQGASKVIALAFCSDLDAVVLD